MAETQEDVEVKQDRRLIETADNVCTNLKSHTWNSLDYVE